MGVAALLALLIDRHVAVSLMKLMAFGVGVTAVMGGADMALRRGNDFSAWFVSIAIFTVIASMAAIEMGVGWNATSATGFSAGLFNGALNQPQVMGLVCSMMVVYLVCLNLYTPYRWPWLSVGIIVCLLLCLFCSSSRSAAITLVVCLSVAVGYKLVSLRGRNWIQSARRSGNLVEILVICSCVLFVTADSAMEGLMRRRVGSFVTKSLQGGSPRYDHRVTLDRVVASRKGQLSMMMANIAEHPWIGIGFGVSTEKGFEKSVTLFSAPTEKGFLPLAVLEETGLVGGAFYVMFIVMFYRHLVRQKNGPGLAMFSALLGANAGEMMFFSFGGIGALMWVLVGGGISLGGRRTESRQINAGVRQHSPGASCRS